MSRSLFDPTTTGPKSAELTVPSDLDNATVGLDGTGTQTELSLDTTSLSFGDQDIDDGATADQTATVTNTGTEAVQIDGVGLSGIDPSEFVNYNEAPNDCVTGKVLIANEACDVRVAFDPATTGTKAADVTVESDLVDDLTFGVDGEGIQTELTPDADQPLVRRPGHRRRRRPGRRPA